MAPLKPILRREVEGFLIRLPCLKGHGPIEARRYSATSIPNGASASRLPCLKGHGPIEASVKKMVVKEVELSYHV